MSVSAAKTLLINSINSGRALTSYFGHSGLNVWTFENLFTANDAANLTNAGKPTVVTQYGCWNTYFVSPQYNTLGHKLLLSGDRGAASVLGAATLTEGQSERMLGQRFFSRLFQPGQTIGSALQGAKADLGSTHPDLLDVLLGWTLLGDPTMVVEP
ncbi:C25 family cysteine peptidase [bacterium]|nr:C25 family cysteine peptidase [bacterium]